MAAGENIVAACYTHATGLPAHDEGRAYLDWCEAKVNLWREMCKEFGYDKPTHEIRILTGSITYHEWLKREVGLA